MTDMSTQQGNKFRKKTKSVWSQGSNGTYLDYHHTIALLCGLTLILNIHFYNCFLTMSFKHKPPQSY